MATRTSKEIYKNYLDTLGEEFGKAYFHAHNEWCDLWLTWRQFENLFGHGPERVDLMNRAGAGFFYRVHRYFFEAATLAVCRLSDPVQSAGKSNLTVKLFEQFMETDKRRGKMGELLIVVNEKTAFARDWRNRRISHNDFALKVGTAVPLQEATREMMSEAIRALYEIFAYVSQEFLDATLFGEVIDDPNNEMVMLNRLFSVMKWFGMNVKIFWPAEPVTRTFRNG